MVVQKNAGVLGSFKMHVMLIKDFLMQDVLLRRDLSLILPARDPLKAVQLAGPIKESVQNIYYMLLLELLTIANARFHHPPVRKGHCQALRIPANSASDYVR